LILIIGEFIKLRYRKTNDQPKVTVVVAARNEENNIARTLDSLVQLDYPSDKLEIIVGDGASEDKTPDIVESYTKKYPFVKLHRVDQKAKIKGKANALDQVIKISQGEFIMITDADCLVQPTWVKETVKYFSEDIGLVCGITIPENKGIFATVQTLDWAYILSTSSAVASLGYPIGGIGNNFSMRKEAYFDVGGYENIPFSITEDYTMFRALANSRWNIRFPLRYETYNSTLPMENLRELYRQKQRWTLGGLDASPLQRVLALLIFLVHLFTLLGFAFLPLNVAITALLVKAFSDGLVLFPALIKLKKISKMLTFPAFEIFFTSM
jgi:cellulose synthase/poly-beta-1,6-N-acetylglucosamine synthase-like glycosyltransferase